MRKFLVCTLAAVPVFLLSGCAAFSKAVDAHGAFYYEEPSWPYEFSNSGMCRPENEYFRNYEYDHEDFFNIEHGNVFQTPYF